MNPYYDEFTKVFPGVNPQIVRAVLDPSSVWYDLALNALGWVEKRDDPDLLRFFTGLFGSIRSKHIVFAGNDPSGKPTIDTDDVAFVEHEALLLLGQAEGNLDLPGLVATLVQQTLMKRSRVTHSMENLFCCLLDLNYGRFDSLLYVSIDSHAITLGSLLQSSTVLFNFAERIFQETFLKARERFLRKVDVGDQEIPKNSPYSFDTIVDYDSFRNAYGKQLHEASLDEPSDDFYQPWKFSQAPELWVRQVPTSLPFALNREEFENRIFEILALARHEYFYLRLFEQNGDVELRDRKRCTVDQLLTSTECLVLNQISPAWDLENSVQKVVSQLLAITSKSCDSLNRGYKERYLNVAPKIPFTRDSINLVQQDFFTMLRRSLNVT
jgi:hypothetical protein